MSKFTKALEKVQADRGPRPEAKVKNENTFRVPPMEEQAVDSQARWDRGLTTLKNTLPHENVVMLRFPDSLAAEQFRMLRTSFRASAQNAGAQVILISSSIHSEGKTVTSCNLAVSLAEGTDQKVLLIDGDLRRGKVSEYIGFGKKRVGLSELIADNLNPKDVMIRNSIPNLVVIPRGLAPKNPHEIISSNRISTIINEMRKHYDYIIIDAPPIMSVADAGILARIADGVIFVIQVGRTPKTVISHSQQLFHQTGAKMIGYVLTNVEYQSSDYRYYDYYTSNYKTEEEEHISKSSKKKKIYRNFQKAGFGVKNAEERFLNWWKEVLTRRKDKKAVPAAKE